VQAIDDVSRKTITSLSTITLKKGTKSEKAMEVGKTISAELQKAGIEKAVFDRGGYKYHGRVQKVAEGLREAGLKI
jgi:large subunit ribosomal protein L18